MHVRTVPDTEAFTQSKRIAAKIRKLDSDLANLEPKWLDTTTRAQMDDLSERRENAVLELLSVILGDMPLMGESA